MYFTSPRSSQYLYYFFLYYFWCLNRAYCLPLLYFPYQKYLFHSLIFVFLSSIFNSSNEKDMPFTINLSPFKIARLPSSHALFK
uniref:Uncharacterized protein n=1 Tax=Panstrongylus lignarius TaxID=156445 RepID=A0A224XSD7_9HEMI